jgi:hypothetical protein
MTERKQKRTTNKIGTGRYLTIERAIGAHDHGTIWERWRFGRLLLVDDKATTPNGHLRNGVLEQLLDAAQRADLALSEREVRYRLQAGRQYPNEASIRHAVAEYRSWHDLAQSGFSQVDGSEEGRPFDPRTDSELRDAIERHNPLPHAWQQSLFPHSEDTDTLADLRRYLEENEEITARYSERDDKRRSYFSQLLKAVNGNESATYGQARALLADLEAELSGDGGSEGAA